MKRGVKTWVRERLDSQVLGALAAWRLAFEVLFGLKMGLRLVFCHIVHISIPSFVSFLFSDHVFYV